MLKDRQIMYQESDSVYEFIKFGKICIGGV